MNTIRLGMTGLEVSRVGVGGIPLLRLAEEDAIKVLQHCFDLGITFIDTARAYGQSEAHVGKAVKRRRQHIVVATKTGQIDNEGALKDLGESLRQLDTDYIDIWQFHGVSDTRSYDEILGPAGAMKTAREALDTGRIRHIGLSTHLIEVALKAVASGLFETVQFPLNFVNNDAVEELVPLAREHDVGFIAMKPFAGGHLKDANLVIKYLLQFGNVLPDPGIQRTSEIDEIAAIVDKDEPLTHEEEQQIEEIRKRLGRPFCQWCGYCRPCPQDIDIPHLMNARNIRSYGEGYFKRVARAVEAGRNCVECGECEEKCPYHLPIRETIAENIEFFDRLMQEAERPWEEAK